MSKWAAMDPAAVLNAGVRGLPSTDVRGVPCGRDPQGVTVVIGHKLALEKMKHNTYVTSFPALASVQKHPVINAILRLGEGLHDLAEELPQKVIVGCLFEAEFADIVHVDAELLCTGVRRWKQWGMRGLTWEALAQLFNGGALFFLANLFVLLLVCGRPQTLPWQTTTKEVHKDMAQRLQVVSPRLLATQVGIDGHVPGRARK